MIKQSNLRTEINSKSRCSPFRRLIFIHVHLSIVHFSLGRQKSNSRTPIVQPVAQRYTDWATTVLDTCVYGKIISKLILHKQGETWLRAGPSGV
jgi:hypothetical protein